MELIGFSSMTGTPWARQTRMTSQVCRNVALTSRTLARFLSTRLGMPQMRVLVRMGARPDPGGPLLALDQLLHVVPSQRPRTMPPLSHPAMSCC
eukprot:11306083-Heterocapsa_arctica.AAC.1